MRTAFDIILTQTFRYMSIAEEKEALPYGMYRTLMLTAALLTRHLVASEAAEAQPARGIAVAGVRTIPWASVDTLTRLDGVSVSKAGLAVYRVSQGSRIRVRSGDYISPPVDKLVNVEFDSSGLHFVAVLQAGDSILTIHDGRVIDAALGDVRATKVLFSTSGKRVALLREVNYGSGQFQLSVGGQRVGTSLRLSESRTRFAGESLVYVECRAKATERACSQWRVNVEGAPQTPWLSALHEVEVSSDAHVLVSGTPVPTPAVPAPMAQVFLDGKSVVRGRAPKVWLSPTGGHWSAAVYEPTTRRGSLIVDGKVVYTGDGFGPDRGVFSSRGLAFVMTLLRGTSGSYTVRTVDHLGRLSPSYTECATDAGGVDQYAKGMRPTTGCDIVVRFSPDEQHYTYVQHTDAGTFIVLDGAEVEETYRSVIGPWHDGAAGAFRYIGLTAEGAVVAFRLGAGRGEVLIGAGENKGGRLVGLVKACPKGEHWMGLLNERGFVDGKVVPWRPTGLRCAQDRDRIAIAGKEKEFADESVIYVDGTLIGEPELIDSFHMSPAGHVAAAVLKTRGQMSIALENGQISPSIMTKDENVISITISAQGELVVLSEPLTGPMMSARGLIRRALLVGAPR